MIAIGRTGDVRGFALAGVKTVCCHTAPDAESLLTAIASDSAVGLLLVPAWVGQVASATLARIRSSRRGPVILVLSDEDRAS